MTKDSGMPTESTSIIQRFQNRGLQRQRVGGSCTLFRLHEQQEWLGSHWACCELQTLGRKRKRGKQLFLEAAQCTEGAREKLKQGGGGQGWGVD